MEKTQIVAIIAIIVIGIMLVIAISATLPEYATNTSAQTPVIDVTGPMYLDESSYIEVTIKANGLARSVITNNGKIVSKRDTRSGKITCYIPLEFGLNEVVITCYDKLGKVIKKEATLLSTKYH